MPEPPGRIVVPLLLALLTLAVYVPIVGHDFVSYDDGLYVTANPWCAEGLSPAAVGWALGSLHASNWHPLTLLSHQLDCQLYGQAPAGHHLSSLLLHLLAVVLLYAVLRAMTGARWRSALVAALFAVHPLHVESVAWVAERKDLLSAVFWLLTMAAYLRYARRPSIGRYLAVAALFLLALASKAMAVTLPCVLLLLDVWPLGRLAAAGGRARTALRLAAEKVPLLALAGAVAALTVIAQGDAVRSAVEVPLGLRLANVPVAFLGYLVKTVVPSGLAVFYPLPASIPAARALAAAAALLALTALAVAAWRRGRPALLVGWLWFLGTLVPVIGLVQVGEQAAADRYTYLPLIGVFIALAWALPPPPSPRVRRAVVAAAALAVVSLALLARLQVGHWRDSERLFRRALAVTEHNDLAHLHLAEALRRRGAPRREALHHYRQALRLRPERADVHAALGNAWYAWAEPSRAVPHLQEAVARDPRDPRLHHNLALALDAAGRVEEAIDHLRRAVALAPGFAAAHHGLGALLAARGEVDQALEHYRAALANDPSRHELYTTIGILLARRGAVEQAVGYLAEAARRQPGSAPTAFNLSQALAQLGRHDEARRWRARALQLDPSLATAPPETEGE